jgi:hypothetical protein
MELTSLPLPVEPTTVKTATRTLLDQAPEIGLATVASGEWIAAPLWVGWQRPLSSLGIDWPAFLGIVAAYQNELRLWVMGERPWDQCITGLAGRVVRRVPVNRNDRSRARVDGNDAWRTALARVGVDQASDLPTLTRTIQQLGLEFTVDATAANHDRKRRRLTGASAIVWAGGKWRDPEVPYGEATSSSSPAAALAEALARFLIKDPGYPVSLARPDVTRVG